jgi:hypothetical protein
MDESRDRLFDRFDQVFLFRFRPLPVRFYIRERIRVAKETKESLKD